MAKWSGSAPYYRPLARPRVNRDQSLWPVPTASIWGHCPAAVWKRTFWSACEKVLLSSRCSGFATAPATVARISAATAEAFGVLDGGAVEVSTPEGSIVVPVEVTDPMVDHVVWLPTNSAGAPVRSVLGVDAGAVVGLRSAPDSALTTQDGVA